MSLTRRNTFSNYLPVPVHLGIFQKTCTGVHIDLSWLNPFSSEAAMSGYRDLAIFRIPYGLWLW